MGIRISEMEEATSFTEEDYVPIVSSGTNMKALGTKIKDFIAGFFVKKSGDTMTGSLRVVRSSNDKIYTQDTRIDESVTPSSTIFNKILTVRDKNDKEVGIVENEQTNAGNIQMSIGAEREVNGSAVYNFLRLIINPSGTRSYSVSDPAAFRSAIETSAAHTPYSNTSSGLSANDVQGAIDEINDNLNTLFKRVRFSATYNISANSNVVLTPNDFNFVAPSGYRELSLYAYTTGNANIVVRNIYADGNVTLKNLSATALSNLTTQIDIIFVKSTFM